MKYLILILSVLSATAVFADTYSCQVKNQMEMIHLVKKYDLGSSGALYILELHTVGEPFAHTATEGLGQLKEGKTLTFKSYDFDLSAVLYLDQGVGSFISEGKDTEFYDCLYRP